jgi:hypothetical protein
VTIELRRPVPLVDVRGGEGCLAATASGRGAVAMVAARGDTRVVAVWEPLRAEPAPALRSHLALALHRSSPAEVVDWSRDERASVVIAEVRGSGEVQLVGWAAPSVLQVSTGRAGLTPLPVPTSEPTTVRMEPGELLVLCSPGVLVEPPACLHADAAALCPAGGPAAWDWAWQGLVRPLREGAVAVVQASGGLQAGRGLQTAGGLQKAGGLQTG